MSRLPPAAFLRRAQHHLRQAGVIAYATESCFGLGCHPLSAKGLKRVIAYKGRPNHKGMIVVAASLAQLRPLLAPLSVEAEAMCQRYWPGPYTLLLPAAKRVLPLLRGRHRTLAVRVTAHPFTQRLCQALGPLVHLGQPCRTTLAAFGSRLPTAVWETSPHAPRSDRQTAQTFNHY